jgi:DNA-binding NarL/FixJ family response regulator
MSDRPPLILALAPDLWFLTRLRTAADAAGAVVEPVRRAERLHERAADARPALIVVDMATPAQDWAAAIRAIKDDHRTAAVLVVAFGPHVDAASQRAARDAGADRVLSNRAFTDTLPRLLTDYLAGSASDTGDREPGA